MIFDTYECRCSARPLARAAAIGLLGCLVGFSANARPVPESATFDDGASVYAPAQRAGVSLQDAVRIATSRYPGQVVRATTNERGGRRVHEVRILVSDQGRVVTVRVDAQTGEMR